jgi:hypothetical protein
VTLYAYCIVPGGHPPPAALQGIAGAAVNAFDAGNVTCWASELRSTPGGGVEVARAHNAVVVAGMDRNVTPVPLRFGQTFPGDAQLIEGVTARVGEWIRLLDHFAGRAEYGVRVTGEEPPAGGGQAARDVHRAAAQSGTAYMDALMRRQAAETERRAVAADIARRVRDAGGRLIADGRAEPLAAGRGVVALAHLVAWNDMDAYHAVVTQVRSELTDFRFLETGPWPPWSFVQ